MVFDEKFLGLKEKHSLAIKNTFDELVKFLLSMKKTYIFQIFIINQLVNYKFFRFNSKTI